ncbi:MAG: amidohydrolase family protein [Spirochaeta sp.]|nr:amidohydrolase family protein [Spirochaeta sp.]
MIIRNASLALPGKNELTPGDLRIRRGKIAEIGVGRTLEAQGDTDIIDAEGLAVLPGAIDAHVHFFDPGYTHKEDFLHASGASASGGVTTVVDMPDTSEPAVIDAQSIQEKLSIVSRKSLIDFGFFGGISGLLCDDQLPRRVAEMAPEVLGIKTYALSGAAHFPRVSNHQYYQVLQETRRHNCIVLVHAEDYDYVSGATPGAQARGDGGMAFYLSRPEAAETLSVLTVTEIAEELGAPMHIVHLGTVRAAEIVATCRFVSGETCPQYLEFDCHDFERIGAPLKITPPVKGPENKAVLLRMLAEGTIDFIASDHAPGTREEKNTGSIWTDYAGIPGGPTLFPYILSEGYLSGSMGLKRFLEVTSGTPARRYRIADRKGSIAVGLDADLVFIDTAGSTVVHGEESFSKGKITPFEGKELRGKVHRTMVRGRTVFHAEEGVTGEPGTGQFLRPDPKLRRAGIKPWRG